MFAAFRQCAGHEVVKRGHWRQITQRIIYDTLIFSKAMITKVLFIRVA